MEKKEDSDLGSTENRENFEEMWRCVLSFVK